MYVLYQQFILIFNILIDNIYSNVITPTNISGNITATISDHPQQFLIAPDIFSNPPFTKLNIFERDLSKVDQQNFILDYLSVDWENLTKVVWVVNLKLVLTD